MEEYEIKHKSRKSNDKGIKNRGKRGNAYCILFLTAEKDARTKDTMKKRMQWKLTALAFNFAHSRVKLIHLTWRKRESSDLLLVTCSLKAMDWWWALQAFTKKEEEWSHYEKQVQLLQIWQICKICMQKCHEFILKHNDYIFSLVSYWFKCIKLQVTVKWQFDECCFVSMVI